MELETVAIESLALDPQNARTHSKRNLDAIKASLSKFGQRKPIVVHNGVVIAGNGTLEAAKLLGWNEISITKCPDEWDADTAKAYAIADNRSAELADWDEIALISQLGDLDASGWDISELGFSSKDFEDMKTDFQENPYTATVNVPQYEIVGDKPVINELYDNSKTKKMSEDILSADIPENIQDFLLIAAHRHTVFNYKKIAEYYPHATQEIQKLMEDSALVIIDLDNAIRNGYVRFAETMAELESLDSGNA